MSTQFTNRQWRLPNNENKDKQSNYSLSFDGTQLIDLENSSLGLTANSISIWFKTTSTTSGQQLLSKMGSTYQFQFRLETNGTITLYSFQDQSTFATLQSASGYNDGNWHNVITTFNTTDGHKMYVDGNTTPVDTDTANKSALQSSSERMLIGVRDSSTGVIDTARYFNGQIDAVSIFNYALSSSQVTTLYGSSSTGIGNPMSLSPKPVAFYQLGDKSAFNSSSYLIPNNSLKDYVFSFDGSNDYINCGNNNSLQATTALTLSAWIKYTTDDTNFRYVLTRRDLNDTNYMLYLNNTTGSKTLKFSSNGSATSSGSVTLNKWHHVAVTVNGTSVSFYIDGQPAGTSTITGINSFADKDFIIGDVTYSTTYEFAGLISNPKMFNTALSSTEVETLYNNGSPLTSMSGFTSLQGWWKLDASATYDGTDWTIPDDSSNSNDGTSSGMTQANLVQSDLSFTSGYSPYALDFDGTNDYIDIVNSSTAPTSLQSLGNSNSYSISSWINTTTTDTYSALWFAGKTILEMRNEGTTGIHVPFNLSVSSGKLFFGRSSNYTTSSENYSSTTSVNTGFWVHCITTVDNNTLKLYINGSLDSTHTFTSATGDCSVGSNTSNFFIGSRSTDGGGNDAYMDGSISNCSIWNTALTSAQVTEIYSEGVPSNLNNHSAYSNLVSWWQLGSNSSFNTNWTVLDEKGSNNGTSSNMTEDDIVDGVGSYANGLSSGMGGDEVIGDAPYSTANSLSVNMDVLDRVTDTPS